MRLVLKKDEVDNDFFQLIIYSFTRLCYILL